MNDGQETPLERKGDGVQSLVALAMMRHASSQHSTSATSIVAIEEPESHLHPSAIHELRAVIRDLANTHQVVLTSHSPLFVNPNRLDNTIIVKGSSPKVAASVAEIREVLGVRLSDNLQNAALILLVEGDSDEIFLKNYLSSRSDAIKKALDEGSLNFDCLHGASSLTYKASIYKNSACQVQCFMDSDVEAVNAYEKAVQARVLGIADVSMAKVPGLQESELEDMFDANVYKDAFLQKFGVNPVAKLSVNTRPKWSNAMKVRFVDAGKLWNNEIKKNLKNWMSDFAVDHASDIVRAEISAPLNEFVAHVERKLLAL